MRLQRLTRKIISDCASFVRSLIKVINMAKGLQRKDADASTHEGNTRPTRGGDIHYFDKRANQDHTYSQTTTILSFIV